MATLTETPEQREAQAPATFAEAALRLSKLAAKVKRPGL